MSNSVSPDISFVVPLYNEAETLPELADRIAKVCDELGRSYEIIFVDDGSIDESAAVIEALHRSDPGIKLIQFRQNYGKSAALSSGFRSASGGTVVTLDADLQDDPGEVPLLLEKMEQGYDLVSGWKKVRRDPLRRRIASRIYNFFTSLFSGIRLHDFNCGLKAYRLEVVKNLNVYGELHRYLPVMAHRYGFRVSEVPVRHHPRRHGRSKFGAARFTRGAFDLITITFLTRFGKRPLHLFGVFGFLSSFSGFIISFYLAWGKIVYDTDIKNRPLMLLGILLIIVGIQFISIGLLGEMITAFRTDSETHLIKRTLGWDEASGPQP